MSWSGCCPRCRGREGPVARLLEQTADAIEAQVQSSQERVGLLGVTLLLAALRANPRLLTEFVSKSNMQNILTKTPFFQEPVREQLQEARLDTRRADLLRVLARKFGSLAEDVAQQVQVIAQPQRLEQLLDLAVDATDLDAFRSDLRL
ncbi:hypothetical protein [Gloeobacter violaceus]|uniref:Gll1642 protein n=1 Tax=Gloeobacter violaceus (strain ATCC 29082 / PCC 7421) TaxID=251221 RepID=Q7NK38_GLOVI|nr:hypothetical protein [Gloeobacter violaceus]BAC89583.1 gll1642 [Gloeobacter violaceus PCC 7421]